MCEATEYSSEIRLVRSLHQQQCIKIRSMGLQVLTWPFGEPRPGREEGEVRPLLHPLYVQALWLVSGALCDSASRLISVSNDDTLGCACLHACFHASMLNGTQGLAHASISLERSLSCCWHEFLVLTSCGYLIHCGMTGGCLSKRHLTLPRDAASTSYHEGHLVKSCWHGLRHARAK